MAATNLTREQLLKHKWFAEDTREDELSRILFSLMHYMDARQQQYRDDDWVHWRLYDNDTALRATGRRARRRIDLRLSLNVVRSCVNTVHSKIIQSKPRPTYLTIGQGDRARQKAKKTQAYSDGLMYHANTFALGSDVVRQAAVFGTGVSHTYMGGDGYPASELIPVRHLKVEHADGRSRNPRNKYIHRPMDRDDLLDRFQKDKEAVAIIKDAPPAPPSEHLYEGEIADQVMVVEAYRRPYAPGESGGRHVVALENGVILNDDKWSRVIPIRELRWGVRPEGFWGYGIAEQLKELQVEINWTLMVATEQMRLSGPKIAIERGSSINEDELSNEIWGIIEYSGIEPKFMMFQSVDPALFQHVDRIYARCFDEVGVSQMTAQGEKPPGLNSGKALMTFSDLETARFAPFGQGYEQWVKETADDLMDTALADEAEDAKKKSIVVPIRDKRRRRYLQKVSRSDVAASRDDMVCQVFPTSALAQQPAQKMQQVGDMQDRGWIQPMEAMQLLDFPDLDNATALATAPLEYIDMCIDRMLEEGIVMEPEPWVNVEMAQERVTHALLRAQIDEVPEERWQLLAAYAKICGDRIQAAKQPPPGAAPPGAPPAAAAPPALPAAA